jgi:signal transduction histidine kinase
MDSAAPHRGLSEEMAPRTATRADVLLALAALPVQDLGAYLQAMAETITCALSVDTTGALIADAGGDALIALGLGRRTSAAEHDSGTDRLPLSESSPLVDVYLSGTPYLAADVRDDPALPRAFASAGIRALLAVPLTVRGERRGILYVASHQPGSFTQEDQALLSVVAARVGLLVENAELAQRRAELEREQARQQVRQEFVGIVSHELKTPVAVIKAYAEALLDRAERQGDAEGARILARIEEQAEQMLDLINTLLDLQRLQSGLMALEESRFDLAELAARVAEELQATTALHRLAVHAAGPVVVHADRRRIEEVLVNLLENAIKYSPQGGDITVLVRRAPRPDGAGEQAVVAVSDRGIGIAPADLPHVFERFYQAAGGRLHKGVRGLGVGLFIAREIVELHGGSMWVESAEGEGSTFYLTLPSDQSAT